MTDEQEISQTNQDGSDEEETQVSPDNQSFDGELEAAIGDLEQKIDPEAVRQAAREVREQLKQEVRDRLEIAAKKRAAEALAISKRALQTEEQEFERFSIWFRIQHIVLFTSCILLIITGLPLKFPNTAWAGAFFQLMGGVTAGGVIHRIGATGLIVVGAFHMIYIYLIPEGRKEFRELFPRFKDVRDVVRNVSYFLGRSKTGARFRRFSYIEKFDYWAVYLGMVVMITSGLMLWFQDRSMAVLPKFFLDMAHEAHSDEALLATLAIIIWHFYNVHLNPDNFPMSWTWLTGKISREKMIRHHPLEYEGIVAERQKLAKGDGKRHQSREVREE